MDTRTPPNASTLAASRLVENLAQPVADALDHIDRELRLCGYPTKHPMSSPSTAPNPKPERDEYGNILPPVTLTGTEQAAAKAEWLRGQRQQIHDDVRAIALIAYSLGDTLREALGTRLTVNDPDKPRCWAGNLDGYHLARDAGGWSDPTCSEIPRAGNTGPCDRCYARHLRYRKRMNLPPLASENRCPAA